LCLRVFVAKARVKSEASLPENPAICNPQQLQLARPCEAGH
jgi:hypothetical protein